MASRKSERREEEEEEESKRVKTARECVALQKVISGGQTGADRAGLEAALSLGLSTGGWAPPMFVTCDGNDVELRTKFGLQEITPYPKGGMSAAYVARSKRNVDDSDATIVFRTHASPGTDKTIGYCVTKQWKVVADYTQSAHRPVLVFTSLEEDEKEAARLKEFLIRFNVKTLNVAGHRQEAKDPLWQQRVTQFLVFAFKLCLP